MKLLGGIEAGGTKFVCGVGSGPEDLIVETFPTTSPAETTARAGAFFRRHPAVSAIGIGSFGPVDLLRGFITSTPKNGWQDFDFVGAIRKTSGVERIAFETDVNAAALGEWRWGAAQGLRTFLYITVGTGIGGGALANGELLHGQSHPEMGHVRVPHDWRADPYAGCCPAHRDCLEGLACGPAIEARWQRPAEALPAEHPAWELEARYLALGMVNWICTLSPERIVLGGGVMRHAALRKLVSRKVNELLNGYLKAPEIVEPALGDRAGVLGAIALVHGPSV